MYLTDRFLRPNPYRKPKLTPSSEVRWTLLFRSKGRWQQKEIAKLTSILKDSSVLRHEKHAEYLILTGKVEKPAIINTINGGAKFELTYVSERDKRHLPFEVY